MRPIKKVFKFIWIGIVILILPQKSKAAKPSEVDKRINNIRKIISSELGDKNIDGKSISFDDYMSGPEWINWNNWGNWGNWNNWRDWNNWNNWANWADWNNWRNY